MRKYTIQHPKDPARPSTNRSSFFTKHKHSTPLFCEKNVIEDENFVKKRL